MRQQFINALMVLVCGIFCISCQSDPIEAQNPNSDYLLQEFVVTYGSNNYYAAIDQESHSMSLANIEYSQRISSVRYTLIDGATISPIPGEVAWEQSQTYTVTLGDKSEKYTLTLPDFASVVEFKSVGYLTAAYFDYDNKIDHIDWGNLSHVVMSFLQVNADGSLQYSSDKLIERLTKLLVEAEANNFEVMISVQSSDTSADNFYQAISNSTLRKSLINSLVAFVDEYDLAGIDIDFEEYSKLGSDYETFLRELGTALDELEAERGREVLYSVAVAPVYNSYPSDLGSIVDFINLMIYDYNWSSLNADHASVDYFKETMAEAAAKFGADARQLIGGVPFYGYTYDNLGASSSASGAAGVQKSYSEIFSTYMSAYGVDQIASSNQIENTVYDGQLKIAEKCQYVVDNTFGGVMIWQLGHDLTSDYSEYQLLPVVGEILIYIDGKEI
ncbi:MAG: glycosyl hydrolase family 18 protein [Rikenellaceae bacterium]